MKKRIFTTLLILLTLLLLPGVAYAREGICGYEGGISSGEAADKTKYTYQEVCFITGKPIVFSGDLTIKKSVKKDITSVTYSYSLANAEHKATLTRTAVFDTTSEKRENGQITESAKKKSFAESIRIDGVTYTLIQPNGYDMTRSNLIDLQPAVNYHSGSLWSKKVYQIGAARDGSTVTVECTGDFYGYDQYWGNAECLTLNYDILCEKGTGNAKDSWGGTAEVKISSTSTEELNYQENKPNEISFSGSYTQSRRNSNILEYTSMLPEFDSKGISTDNMIKYKDSLSIETFPAQRKLPTTDAANIRAHWAEKELRIMFGLEAFKAGGVYFEPDDYMSRAEFAYALVQIVKPVPEDPALSTKTVSRTNRKASNEVIVSPFNDVSIGNVYFPQIKEAYERKLLNGNDNDNFRPNGTISRAEAIVAIVRALGFEKMAPTPVAVTSFRDNDIIPSYARNSAYIAQKIGLLKSDSRGRMNPLEKLTKADVAFLLNDLVEYLQDGIRKDYREAIVNY